MTGVGKQQRIAEDEVRHVSSPSGGHIIVAQQIQSLLELAGKWFERMIDPNYALVVYIKNILTSVA